MQRGLVIISDLVLYKETKNLVGEGAAGFSLRQMERDYHPPAE